ncbi:MAG: hypothetical protein LBL34_00655 [Clostridiales bacterium]|nr:hypothetical protein [Clostridiales bacterium]
MKKKILAASGILAVIMSALVMVIAAAPGADDDPVVSLSYVEQRITQVKAYVDGEVSKLTPGAEVTATSFRVIEVPNGKRLLCNEGTEMILRQGTAKIFATKKGGISNTTAGHDLADGVDAPPNALLIVPLDDGRGLVAQTDLLVMVKGSYAITD